LKLIPDKTDHKGQSKAGVVVACRLSLDSPPLLVEDQLASCYHVGLRPYHLGKHTILLTLWCPLFHLGTSIDILCQTGLSRHL